MLARSAAVILLVLCSSRLAAQHPRTPFVTRGACPFECCQLYLADDEHAPAATQADSARLTAWRQPLAPGDTVYLIGEVSEVGERVWTHGRAATVEGFWAEAGVEDANAPAILVRPIVHEWWVHIDAHGRRGWIQAWERNLEGTDACA